VETKQAEARVRGSRKVDNPFAHLPTSSPVGTSPYLTSTCVITA
jgi:hypothetical protein